MSKTPPWRYRPLSEEEADWQDNPASNTLAWISDGVLPDWCKDEDHWTIKFTTYLWAECYCCSSFRWLSVGAVVGFLLGLII